MLAVKTDDLWPIKVGEILKSKNISEHKLNDIFTNIIFPWNDEYNSLRTYFSLRI